MNKVKLNKDFNFDSKTYTAGIVELPENHYELMKKLDVNGMELMPNTGQTPLISEITNTNTNAKPDKV